MYIRALPLVVVVVFAVGALIFNSDVMELAAFDSEPEIEAQVTIDEQNAYIAELEQRVSELSAEVADLREENRWDTVVFLNDPDGLLSGGEFQLISEYRNREGEANFYEVNSSRLDLQNVSTGVSFQIDALIGELVVIHPPTEEGGSLTYDACFNGFTCRVTQEQARIVDD